MNDFEAISGVAGVTSDALVISTFAASVLAVSGLAVSDLAVSDLAASAFLLSAFGISVFAKSLEESLADSFGGSLAIDETAAEAGSLGGATAGFSDVDGPAGVVVTAATAGAGPCAACGSAAGKGVGGHRRGGTLTGDGAGDGIQSLFQAGDAGIEPVAVAS